jgi:hypothetical protein
VAVGRSADVRGTNGTGPNANSWSAPIFFKIIFFMINYKFRSCYKKMNIYKSVDCSMADWGLVGNSLADRYVLLNATWQTCMLLCQRACYYSWVCGAPRDKFRGLGMHFQSSGACGTPRDKFRVPEMHFQSSGAYVTHTYKFRGLWCI